MDLHTTNAPAAWGLLRLFRRRAVAAGVARLLLLVFGLLSSGCQSYYRSRETEASRQNVSLLAESKVFVVHQGAEVWELREPRLSGEVLTGSRTLTTGRLDVWPAAPATGQSARYRAAEAPVVLNIVHVYLRQNPDQAPAGADGQVSIPLASIRQIDLLEKDTGKTTASYVLGIAGATVAVMAILLVIVALTKSSCPFVYAHDGQSYRFVGEAYGGAIFAPAERTDYLPLPGIRPRQGNQYQVRISNELKERQHTNLAELWVAQHPAGTQVLLDQKGRAHTLRAPQAPTQARTGSGGSCEAQLRARDHDAVMFNDEQPGAAPNEVVLTFERPAGARAGKLLLRAQNSLWLDYLYGEFIGKFGGYYNTWAAGQATQPAAINRQWGLDQHLPLNVYVDAGRGWELAETIPTVGPLAARDLVVPLDFGTAGAGAAAGTGAATGPVRVKLSCGFMFWEVDYAALDCTPNEAVQLDNCRLQSARTERGADARPALAADDTRYLRQLQPGTAVSLHYETRLPAPTAGLQRSVFLRTKGYYEHLRDFQGLPNLPALYAFRRPGRFIEFSKERYRETTRDLMPATASR